MKINVITLAICLQFLVLVSVAQTDQTLVYGTYYGTDVSTGLLEELTTVRAMPDGGFVIGGTSPSLGGLSSVGAYQVHGWPGRTAFLARFDENFNRVWGTYFGGWGTEDGVRSAVLSDGSIMLSGFTSSDETIATEGSYMENLPEDATGGFLARFDSDGFPIWSTYFAGEAHSHTLLVGISVLPNDNVALVGTTTAQSLPVTVDAFETSNPGGSSGFLAIFNNDGELLYCTYIGGSDFDFLYAVHVDFQGDILVGGRSSSSDFPVTQGAHQTELQGGQDAVLVKFTGTGSLLWSTFFGGGGWDDFAGPEAISTDDNGNVCFVGVTDSNEGIATTNAFQEELLGVDSYKRNGFVAMFTPFGELQWATYIGSHNSLASSANYHEDLWLITGYTNEGSGIAVGSPYQGEFPGDASSTFISAFTSEGEYFWGTYYGGSLQTNPFTSCMLTDGLLALGGATNSPEGIVTEDAFMPIHPGGINGFLALFELDFGVSVPEKEHLSLNAYPNPTTQHLWLDLPPSFAFHAEVSVYNSVGQLVQRHTQFSSHEPLSLQHPPGLYIVEARKGDNALRAKVVVR